MKYTIFTPSYNRANFLPRVYNSLLKQYRTDFEWLIIDDGSSDNTEAVVSKLINEQKISIRYIKKSNGGKHTAHNVGVMQASGEWFMCLDSDDILVNNALSILDEALVNVKKEDCGLIGYKKSTDGDILSGDIVSYESKHGLYGYMKYCGGYGEYTLVFRTEVLKKKLFPEIEGEHFMTECVLYDQLELAGYTLAIVPNVIQICEYQKQGLTSNIYQSLINCPVSYQIYHMQRIDLVYSLKERCRHALQYQTFKIMSRNVEYKYTGKYMFLVKIMYPLGYLGVLYYLMKIR